MKQTTQMIIDLPALSDEAASETLDFLYQLTTSFENHYRNQLQRYYKSLQPPKPDLLDDLDDELPPF